MWALTELRRHRPLLNSCTWVAWLWTWQAWTNSVKTVLLWHHNKIRPSEIKPREGGTSPRKKCPVHLSECATRLEGVHSLNKYEKLFVGATFLFYESWEILTCSPECTDNIVSLFFWWRRRPTIFMSYLKQ